MRKVFFINKDGNEIFDENACCHAELAMKVIKENDKIMEEMKGLENRDKAKKAMEFLQETNGYMMGSEQGEYKRIVFDSQVISDEQKALLRRFYEQGYELSDIYLERKRKEKAKGEER